MVVYSHNPIVCLRKKMNKITVVTALTFFVVHQTQPAFFGTGSMPSEGAVLTLGVALAGAAGLGVLAGRQDQAERERREHAQEAAVTAPTTSSGSVAAAEQALHSPQGEIDGAGVQGASVSGRAAQSLSASWQAGVSGTASSNLHIERIVPQIGAQGNQDRDEQAAYAAVALMSATNAVHADDADYHMAAPGLSGNHPLCPPHRVIQSIRRKSSFVVPHQRPGGPLRVLQEPSHVDTPRPQDNLFAAGGSAGSHAPGGLAAQDMGAAAIGTMPGRRHTTSSLGILSHSDEIGGRGSQADADAVYMHGDRPIALGQRQRFDSVVQALKEGLEHAKARTTTQQQWQRDETVLSSQPAVEVSHASSLQTSLAEDEGKNRSEQDVGGPLSSHDACSLDGDAVAGGGVDVTGIVSRLADLHRHEEAGGISRCTAANNHAVHHVVHEVQRETVHERGGGGDAGGHQAQVPWVTFEHPATLLSTVASAGASGASVQVRTLPPPLVHKRTDTDPDATNCCCWPRRK